MWLNDLEQGTQDYLMGKNSTFNKWCQENNIHMQNNKTGPCIQKLIQKD